MEALSRKLGANEILKSPVISALAMTIVRKCGGLPLALGKKKKKTKEEWRYAIEVLHKTPSEL